MKGNKKSTPPPSIGVSGRHANHTLAVSRELVPYGNFAIVCNYGFTQPSELHQLRLINSSTYQRLVDAGKTYALTTLEIPFPRREKKQQNQQNVKQIPAKYSSFSRQGHHLLVGDTIRIYSHTHTYTSVRFAQQQLVYWCTRAVPGQAFRTVITNLIRHRRLSPLVCSVPTALGCFYCNFPPSNFHALCTFLVELSLAQRASSV